MDLARRLAFPKISDALARLRFRPEDAADVLTAREAVLASDADRAIVEGLASRIIALNGNYLAETLFTDDEVAHPLGFGVPLILAFLATTDEALAWRPGQPDELAWGSLADFGQQVHINRLVHGEFGLHTYEWVQGNWAGGLLWLGRLQFNVGPMWINVDGRQEGEPAWFVHIPQSGPLTDADAVASVERARVEMARYYPDAGDRFYCGSWLLDPKIVEIVGPDSNIGRFAGRFGPPLTLVESDRDVLFFAFLKEPPVDLATLPRDNRLHRGIVEHLEAGGHFHEALCRWEG